MNIEDLRHELSSRADGAEGAPHSARVDGVRHKVQGLRRRRASASVAAAAVAAVTVLIGVPQLGGLLGSHRAEPAGGPSARSSPKYPQLVNGRALVASTVGDVGKSRVSLRVVPGTLDLAWAEGCSRAARRPSDPVIAVYEINGHRVGFGRCQLRTSFGGSTYSMPASRLRHLGVRPGSPMVLSAHLEDRSGSLATARDVTLGLAVYVRDFEHLYAFPGTIDASRQLLSNVNEPGQSRLSWSVALPHLRVGMSQFCRVAGVGSGSPAVTLHLSLNGHELSPSECSATDSAGDRLVAVSPAIWHDAGVQPRHPFSVTLRLEDGDGQEVHLPGARFGVGFYSLPSPVNVGGVTVSRLQQVQGGTYDYSEMNVYELANPQGMSQTKLSPSKADRLLMWGGNSFPVPVRLGLFVDDELVSKLSLAPSTGALIHHLVPAGGRHTVTVRVLSGKPTSGKLLQAYYDRVP